MKQVVQGPSGLSRLFQHRWAPAGFALYFAVVAILQLLASPTAELDQAEQLVLAQRLQWGYTNQPPLFTWLAWGLFQLTGPSLAVLYGIKVGLLSGFVLAVVGICRQLDLSPAQRQLALAGTLLLPAVIWEAQRDLTHSLSATTFAAVTLWCALWALRCGGWWRYALVGAAAAASLLSKHNTIVFLAAMLLAVLWTPVWRARLRLPGLLIAAVVAALLCAPHAWWLHEHAQVLARTLHKLSHGQSWWAGHTRLVFELAEGVLSFLVPWLFVAAPMAWLARRDWQGRNLTSHLVLTAGGVLLVFVLAIGADSFKGRWLFPLLFFMPVCLAAGLPSPSPRGLRIMTRSGVAVALLCGVVLPARLVWPMPGAAQTRQNLPIESIAAQLTQVAGGVPEVVLASNHLLGGNLRLWWPERVKVLTPIVPWVEALPDTVLVVATDKDLKDEDFGVWLQQATGQHADQIDWQGTVSAPLLHRPRLAPYQVRWARLTLPPH